MDHRTNVRAVRALADGPEAFWATVHDTPGFDGRSFGEFATRNLLFSWIGPLLEDDRLHELVPADLLEGLVTRWASARRRNVALMDVSKRLATLLDDAGIESLFLKGLIFAERFYGDVHRRHQMDVDVLVRPAALDAALATLGASGFDTSIDQESGRPMQERLQRIRRPGLRRVPHAVEVRGGDVTVDLHWCLRSRALTRRQEERIWSSRTGTSLAGTPLHTLSDEHTLTFLLLSIGSDVKRGALRVKHFLDLYLLLRAREHEIDWKAFFARRADEGLLRICVNVLAIFVVVWNSREEFPELGQALEERSRLVELRDEAEAVALLERPRGNAENHLWRRRVLPSSRWAGLALRLTIDLPHTLSRLGSSGHFRGRLAAVSLRPAKHSVIRPPELGGPPGLRRRWNSLASVLGPGACCLPSMNEDRRGDKWVMRIKAFALVVSVAGWAGCGQGGTWVDTTSGDCTESQIEETRQNPELFADVGTRTCQENGMGGFAGAFRCAGSEEDGTRRLQAKCEA